MKPIAIICLTTLFCLAIASCCYALDDFGNWIDSTPQIRTHGTFYPHPHMKDLKALAKRGKILVITLVVSAGLLVLVSTAVIRGGKGKEETDETKAVDPAELRSRVIAAAAAGRQSLSEGQKRASNMALRAYANACSVEWVADSLEYSASMTCNIGRDHVTIVILNGSDAVEVRAVCGNMIATAIANAKEDSISSSVFKSNALDREQDI